MNSELLLETADFAAFDSHAWVNFFHAVKIRAGKECPGSGRLFIRVGHDFVEALRRWSVDPTTHHGNYGRALLHSSARADEDWYVHGRIPGRIIGMYVFVDPTYPAGQYSWGRLDS